MAKLLTNDFKSIVLNNTPLIDVRAPIEFEKGAFPGAVNLPIMNDEERHVVGIKYKESGNESATALGHELVSGSVKAERILAWQQFISANDQAMLYCFRGGSRSRISQEWLLEEGIEIPRLEGGYKAFRQYLMDHLDPVNLTAKPIILTGYTGSGKTLLLNKLPHAIDLEGIAHHRGSAFGNYMDHQPSQINFENRLSYQLIAHKEHYSHMIIEDESRNIGKCYIPKPLLDYFRSGIYVMLDIPVEERVAITYDEYVVDSQKRYISRYGDEGLSMWHAYIVNSMEKVKKRLGGDRFMAVINLFEEAYILQCQKGDLSAHKKWIALFLTDYYDPMYQYQLSQKENVIAFKGNHNEVYDYLMQFIS